MRLLIATAAAAVLAFSAAAPLQAQFFGTEATEVKPGYRLKPGEPRILVFRPDVRVGEQTTGGMNEPSVEWTEAAKAHIAAALQKEHAARGSQLVMVPEIEGDQGKLVADYTALFKTVADAALNHKLFDAGNRLPSKRGDTFDWTLGEGAARLKTLGGDYGLFLYTYDSYGSTGRKMMQVLGAVAGFGFVPSGVHIGYAGLVDLDTGDLVWLNADVSMGGDVREAEGAQKRVKQLMEEFPIRAEGVPVPEGTVTFDPPLPPEEPEESE